jgi:hypothetical protein
MFELWVMTYSNCKRAQLVISTCHKLSLPHVQKPVCIGYHVKQRLETRKSIKGHTCVSASVPMHLPFAMQVVEGVRFVDNV